MHVLKKGVAEEAQPVTSVAVRAASDGVLRTKHGIEIYFRLQPRERASEWDLESPSR